ncbi:MAG: SDR family NAD(P)-dependent oxidoreductase, partial [Nitrosarchaeum sp.]
MYNLADKVILVSGGTGSLGQTLVPFLMREKVKKIIIYSRGEYAQVMMERKFTREKYPIRYFIGDVRDKQRLKRALCNVDIAIHLAAIKHIDKAQYDPFEAINTNVIGSENLINASIDCGIEKVLAITSDKEVSPTSLYGASKQAATFMFIAANNYSPKQTKFSVIRFGNFWNSSGSFI